MIEAYVRGVDLDRLGLEEESEAPFMPPVCGRYESCESTVPRMVPVHAPSKADHPPELRLVAVACGLVHGLVAAACGLAHGLAHRVAHRVLGTGAAHLFCAVLASSAGGARESADEFPGRAPELARASAESRAIATKSLGTGNGFVSEDQLPCSDFVIPSLLSSGRQMVSSALRGIQRLPRVRQASPRTRRGCDPPNQYRPDGMGGT